MHHALNCEHFENAPHVVRESFTPGTRTKEVADAKCVEVSERNRCTKAGGGGGFCIDFVLESKRKLDWLALRNDAFVQLINVFAEMCYWVLETVSIGISIADRLNGARFNLVVLSIALHDREILSSVALLDFQMHCLSFVRGNW